MGIVYVEPVNGCMCAVVFQMQLPLSHGWGADFETLKHNDGYSFIHWDYVWALSEVCRQAVGSVLAPSKQIHGVCLPLAMLPCTIYIGAHVTLL